MQKVFDHCNFFYHIFHIKPHFFTSLFQNQFLLGFLMKYLPTKAELNVDLHRDFSIIL